MSETTQGAFPITDYDAPNSIPTGDGVCDVTGERAALKYINDGWFDAVLTDIRMPVMDGCVTKPVEPRALYAALVEATGSVGPRGNKTMGPI